MKYGKHLRVEVYLEFKLCIYPRLNEHVVKSFNLVDTVGKQSACRFCGMWKICYVWLLGLAYYQLKCDQNIHVQDSDNIALCRYELTHLVYNNK